MHFKPIIVILIILITSGYTRVVKAEDIRKDTSVRVEVSDWRPYAYEENGLFKGFAYEIVKDVFERAGIPYEFSIEPWSRVYLNGLSIENYMIAGVGRTEKREKLFNWVGPVTKGIDIFFYQLRGNPIPIKNIEDAKNYRVAVERDSYYHDFLITHGFNEDKIHAVTRSEQLLTLVQIKRDRLFVLEERRVLHDAQKLNIDPLMFEKVIFAFNVTDYMALSKNTSPVIFDRIKKSYQALKKEGKISLH